MSRLDFAPGVGAMEVTNIETGHFVFAPKEGKKVSYEELDEAIQGAGYKIDKGWIRVTGTVGDGDQLRVEDTGQTFRLTGEVPKSEQRGGQITVVGRWKVEEGKDAIVVGEEPAPKA